MNKVQSNLFPRIASSSITRLSEWVAVVENRVVASVDGPGATYHCFAIADYISILVLTPDERIPLVRQFRPALNRFTLEFPGGLRDADEEPIASATRELAEEVGLHVETARPLALFHPDSGRLGNSMWTFFARDAAPIPGWRAEHGVERILVTIEELYALAQDGKFDHGPHLAMLGMALLKGLLPAPPA